MQTYVLLALAGFLFALVAAICIGTLLRRARPTRMATLPPPVVPPRPLKDEEPPPVLPFDDSTLADETQPARPTATMEYSPLPDIANVRTDTLTAAAGEDAVSDPDHVSLLIEPDDEPTPQQRSVRRLIAYFKEKPATVETAATS